MHARVLLVHLCARQFIPTAREIIFVYLTIRASNLIVLVESEVKHGIFNKKFDF